MKTTDLSLEELYAKPKITPSIEAAIILKEDFTEIQSNYCDKICRLTCKSYAGVDLNHDRSRYHDITRSHAYDDGYKEGYKIEQTHRRYYQNLLNNTSMA
jgi:hypothetical protein